MKGQRNQDKESAASAMEMALAQFTNPGAPHRPRSASCSGLGSTQQHSSPQLHRVNDSNQFAKATATSANSHMFATGPFTVTTGSVAYGEGQALQRGSRMDSTYPPAPPTSSYGYGHDNLGATTGSWNFATSQLRGQVFRQNNAAAVYTQAGLHASSTMQSPVMQPCVMTAQDTPGAPANMGIGLPLHHTFGNTSIIDPALSTSQIAARHVLSKDLPIFSGKPEEWPLFITNYEQSTERCGFSEQENLLRLQKCLRGPALESVRGKLMIPATVPYAIETLRMLYGRPDVIHHTMQRKLRQEPVVKPDRLETLVKFALAVQNYRATMQALGLTAYLNDPMLLSDLLVKLPSDLKLDWGRRRLSLARVDIAVFDDWLFDHARCATLVTPLEQIDTPKSEEQRGGRNQRERILVHDIVDGAATLTCLKCGENHQLADCGRFQELDARDRWQFVLVNKLCLRCFKAHFVRRCHLKKQCGVDGCSKAHHPLLHTRQQVRNTSEPSARSAAGLPNRSRPNNNGSTVLFHTKQQKTLFRYVPVILYGKTKVLHTYALIDEGSACTLIENDIADELGLHGPVQELCLRWTNDIVHNEVDSRSVTVAISSREAGSPRYCLQNIRTISSLDLPEQTLDDSVLEQHGNLRGLPIRTYHTTKARILIGIDHIKIGVPREVREGDNDLVAVKCALGWSVYGRQDSTTALPQRVLHICKCSAAARMDELMQAYFAIDAIGVGAATPLVSKADKRATKIMEATTKYLPKERRWETGLLWKYDCVELPDSLSMARRRLKCLEAKMLRNPTLRSFMVNTIRDYEQKGYVKRLERHEVSQGGITWYIPIFTVTNPNKNKTRLVWDAAATVSGVALNTVLLKGPDLLKSLVGVLLRFREKPVALCGDIREMFHQVRIRAEDQAAQQFIWRDGDSSREPDVYAMTVMTFGASCSPSLANYIKNKNATRFESKFPQAVSAIIENTFVDDWLQSVDTEENMIQLAQTVRWIHAEGGFEMRNWLSNSKAVLHALTGQHQQPDRRIEEPDTKYEKVLGMWWAPSTDELTFVEKFDKDVFDTTILPTKRHILRVIMTIFDPLGFLGFFVIHAKIILQEVWRSGVTWDEPMFEDQRNKWWQWVKKVPAISNIRLPRCYPLINRDQHVQLHVFVDASVNAYAAAAYLRASKDGVVRCCLVASKTRVAPLKPVSIPRLELMAAILGLRLAKFVENELSLPVARRTFWSDSKNVLYWIRSDARKFHQFVALRVGEILEGSQVSEWRWVPTQENVADEGTKWGRDDNVDNNCRWFSGPDFLKLPEGDWPRMELPGASDPSEMLCHIVLEKSPAPTVATITPEIEGFSKWERLCNAQRYVLIFLRSVVKRAQSPLLKKLVGMRDYECIQSVIIRGCQEKVFAEEIACLRSDGGKINRQSDIYRCSPYLDEFGLLRVKGRIDAVDGVIASVKRPIILPRNHRVAYLVADYYHRKFHHHHNEIIVNEMRQQFWVSRLRTLVAAVARKCQKCRNRRAVPCPPQMSDLPPERLATFTRPFTYTGADYFGPFDVVIGRRHEKRWGVIFTCLTIRAVHIEMASSLSTDSFLLLLKQFICRRGVPRRIITDNGTNFRGASRILMTEIEKISTSELEQRHPEIEWSFIPPASPHMGGAWERMVRSVKSVLMDILPDTAVQEETLRAALIEVESIINMRPLTYVPLDSPESEALTPNHFLVGNSNGIRERSDNGSSGAVLQRNFRIAGQITDRFWKRWVREYLPSLTRRTKWIEKPLQPISVGDVVIIVDEANKRSSWPKGVIFDVRRAKDGQIRSAVVKTQNGLITRPTVRLAKLDVRG